jgi:hypothetical protein
MIDQLGDAAILTVVSVVHRQPAQSNLARNLAIAQSRVSWLPSAVVHKRASLQFRRHPHSSVQKRELRSPLYIGRNLPRAITARPVDLESLGRR